MQLQLEKHTQVFQLSGATVGKGGEATVYEGPNLPDRPTLVAKVYHKPTPRHAAKLAAMLLNPPEDPMTGTGHVSIAWPLDRVLAPLTPTLSHQGGEGELRCVGYIMPRVENARPIFEFYNPKSRLTICPQFHYKYLLRTARNLATAVRAIHERGYVIGDLNESNILVTNQALVTLVDTDSFQVPDNGQIHRCPVGKPEYTPPELQGVNFAEVDRQQEHDNFALGVLIFQLLMQGIHPFLGKYTGQGEPGNLGKRVGAGLWPYARSKAVPFEPMPHAPPFQVLPASVRELMVRCFEEGHERPERRPKAGEWKEALKQAEEQMVLCTVNPQHYFHGGLKDCPWCELRVRLGRDPFPSKEAIKAGLAGTKMTNGAPTVIPVAVTAPTPPPATTPAALPPGFSRVPKRSRPSTTGSKPGIPVWLWAVGGGCAAFVVVVAVIAVMVAGLGGRPKSTTNLVAEKKKPEPAWHDPYSPSPGAPYGNPPDYPGAPLPGPGRDLSLDLDPVTVEKASVHGKYAFLLRAIDVPEDRNTYTDFSDYGYFSTTSWKGHNNLPAGYWVYVYPNWYIWRDLAAVRPVPPGPPPIPAPMRSPVTKERSWSVEQVVGEPDTPQAGDFGTAWASSTADGQDEWLELEYAVPVVPTLLKVYETYNPGAVYRVTVFKPSEPAPFEPTAPYPIAPSVYGTEVEVWAGTDPTPVDSDKGISEIPLKVKFKTNRVRIYLKSKEVPGYNEIDAVGLVDDAGKTHWAINAVASSTYGDPVPQPGFPMRPPALPEPPRPMPLAPAKRSWGPEQATGAPDAPDEPGDHTEAWASKTADGQAEWLLLDYAEPVVPEFVHVYENYNPGVVYKVTVFDANGREIIAWQGRDPIAPGSGKGIAKIRLNTTVKTQRVRIFVNSRLVPGWNEIDAVGLVDKADNKNVQWAVSASASSSYADY